MRFIYMATVMLLLVIAQLWVGNLGLVWPLAAAGCFYFTVAYGWRTGLANALVVGMALDALFGAELPLRAGLLALTVIWAEWRVRVGEYKGVANLLLAGSVNAVLVTAPAALWQMIGDPGMANLYMQLRLVFFAGISGMLLAPLAVLLDVGAESLAVARYRDAEKRLERGT